MRVAGSTRCYLDPREEWSLSRMARDRRRPSPRAEDGELSDAGSPEEASTKRFELEPSRISRSGMWGFSYPRNYAPELYNLAWARAVQNKPLELDFVGPPAVGEEEEEEVGEDEVGPGESGGGDGEGEEGELEEGEIEFGSEAVAAASEPSLNENEKELEEDKGVEGEEGGEEMGDFDRQVSLILEELETVTKEEVEKSFEQVCTRLRKSFESLKPMVSETHMPPVINVLVQQAFMGMQTIHSVVSLGGLKKMEQNKDLFLRLLIHLKNQYYILLTPEQLQEIDTMVKSLVFENDSKEKDINAGSGGDTNNFAKIAEKPDIPSHGMVSLEKPCVDQRAFTAGLSKLELPMIPRIKTEFSPLLDLHADYDESSLPSPTRENPPPLPVQRPIEVGMGDVIPTQPITTVNTEAEDATVHPYVTDPLKAVSTYQQKYGRSSLFSTNQLPSPTPSEESNDGNDGDLHGEVSSSLAAGNAGASNPLPSSLHVVSSGSDAFAYNSSGHQQPPVKTCGPSSSLPSPVTKAPAKSRDPRLRFINSEPSGGPNSNRHPMSIDSNAPKNGSLGEIVNSRKHKDFDESVLDDRNLKRQRNSNTSSAGMQAASGNGGWLEDSNIVIHQPSDKNHVNENVPLDMKKLGDTETGSTSSERRPDTNTKFASNGGVGQKPSTSAAASVCSPSLLKDFKDIGAVNPTMLIQLLQQRLAAETQQKTTDPVQLPSRNGLLGTVPALNIAPMKSTETDQNQAGRPQMPAQSASMNARNDIGRIRMKARDPRRILHNNIIQKNENLGSELSKTNGNLSLDDLNNKDNIKVREPGEQTQTAGLPCQSTPLPDVAWRLTKNVNNLADIVPSSQLTSNSPALPQNNSQPITGKNAKADIMPATTEASIQKPALSSSCEVGMSSASHLPNLWGDVDHLLDGYDDQQKAAIQRERARRIEEQNKMFASRKLCLVLDLDHTLLNSAKFAEVDPVHDEILRKKEELDREKPQRHLFRFLHMGMWTKLRPGIWNFLEKASKLYELHLYTMGNKLYATEMAKVLDPTGALFAGRVISRGDDGDPFDGDDRVPKSKDLDGVLGMESAVVIIDDSLRVWPHNKLNLIVVERYTYFPCSRRQFGLFGPSLLEIDHDERPEDGTLASSLAVIERIHQNFFSHRSLNEVDVRNILAAEQHKILAGCKIVFSRIFPVGEANPHLHPLWQTAEQFGAVCTNQIDEQVTHVVANSLGTDKVNWALSTGRFVVHPGWVEASALLYRRANELDFLVKQ